MNTWDISKLWPQHIALSGVWDCVCPPANSQTTKLRPPRVYRIDFTMVFNSRKKRIPINILQSGAVLKQGYPATPKIIQAIRPWISIETYGDLGIRYSNRNLQIKSQLVGNGAARRLVVLRACAWISHWNCLCSVARLFLDVLRTTSTIEQLAASFSELLPRSSVLRHIHYQTLCSNFEEWVTKSPVPLFLEASLGSQHFNDFQSESMVCVPLTNVTWTLTSHPTPPQPRPSSKKITLLRVILTMTLHFVTGKSSGILSDIFSGIRSGILSGTSSGILPGISSGRCSGISSGISSGICSGISSGIPYGILSGISSGILSGKSSGIPSGILSSISSGILSGKSAGILSGKHSGTLSGISSGILADILSGILSGIPSGILSGISSNILSGISSATLCGISFGVDTRGWGPAGNTGRGWSWLRSGREHWAWMVVVEVRQGTLGVDGRGWGPAGNTGRGWSWLRSGREHWAWMVVVEVRQGTLGVDGRGWGPTENTVDRESQLSRRTRRTTRGGGQREEEERRRRQEEEEEAAGRGGGGGGPGNLDKI